MKKLHSFAFYALIAPVITLGAGSLLAQQPADQEIDREQQYPRGQDSTRSVPLVTEGEQNSQRAGQSAADRLASNDQSNMKHQGYMSSAPANGMQANNLIGAEVTTTGDENVGPVEDLIINQDGQIVAIVVGVGGFLGLGEKKVAIGWDDITISVGSDEIELQVSATRDALSSAPEYEEQD